MRRYRRILVPLSLALASIALVCAPPAAATGASPGTTQADTAAKSAEPSGDNVLFTGIRVARQDGFDRVVWEFSGTGMPGYQVAYTDDPRRDGSGFPVDLPGGTTLAVGLSGVRIPTEPLPGEVPYPGPEQVAAAGTVHVTEVLAGAWFEAHQDGFVGVRRQEPFRVYTLEGPPRVVVEIVDTTPAVPTAVPAGDGSGGWDGPLGAPVGLVIVASVLAALVVVAGFTRRGSRS